ncbi:MAG: 3-phosphoshikimate 1-carboxyvinyltransferase [Solirubrobacterales bacterium]|nr:3-phosphoshikimate 1-carboxyvinyltransferase [Solirubrobacterales bacterium]
MERRGGGRPPPAARGAARRGAAVRTARVGAEPARGGRRACARARARRGQHHRHGALPGAGHERGRDRPVDRRRGAGAPRAGARGAAGVPGGAAVNARFEPSGRLRGTLRVPADKSVSHRAAIIAAMAAEPVRIGNYLDAADTRSTLRAVQELGALVDAREGELVIRGCGLRNARSAAGTIDVGNAGTLMRLLPGWLAFQAGLRFTLDGDASIRRRPVDRIAQPLSEMGARLEAREGRYPPFTIHGAPLRGIEYRLPVASAQVKSCLLLAGLVTEATTVVEPVPARDHTERLLLRAGAPVARTGSGLGEYRTTVCAADELELERIDIPGDLSSAAFLITAGVIVRGSRLVLEDVGVNWTRAGFLRVLERMGAIVLGDVEPEGSFSALEPATDLDVQSAPIEGTTVDGDEVPLTIDELPLVALLGCFADGDTVVRGAAELRVKESDRIATVVSGLRGLGADIEALPDGFAVHGTAGLRGGSIDAHGDHRLALLGAVAGLASAEGVEVAGMEAAAVSYPGFTADVAALLS